MPTPSSVDKWLTERPPFRAAHTQPQADHELGAEAAVRADQLQVQAPASWWMDDDGEPEPAKPRFPRLAAWWRAFADDWASESARQDRRDCWLFSAVLAFFYGLGCFASECRPITATWQALLRAFA